LLGWPFPAVLAWLVCYPMQIIYSLQRK